ncbi:MAG TPA: hypothetical protein VGY94_11195 [Acidobacteriaceae bacterium]|jgi:hypothetical protein|nr:hypothetical protein [Acidobacteriaceae bacterium]
MKRLLSLALLAVLPLTALAKDEASKLAGTYKGETRAKDESRGQSQDGTYAIRHHTMTLDLGKDGTATLTQSPDSISEITSFAHWSLQGDVLKLTFDPVDKQATPAPMTFRYDHKTLTPVVYNHDLWRTLPPPSLKFQKQHDVNGEF